MKAGDRFRLMFFKVCGLGEKPSQVLLMVKEKFAVVNRNLHNILYQYSVTQQFPAFGEKRPHVAQREMSPRAGSLKPPSRDVQCADQASAVSVCRPGEKPIIFSPSN
jgi:hypothetical protein